MILFHKANGFYAPAKEFVVFTKEPPADCNWEDWFNERINEARPIHDKNGELWENVEDWGY